MTAEELLLAALDVPYDHLVAHRIKQVLLVRMQAQSILRHTCQQIYAQLRVSTRGNLTARLYNRASRMS